MFAGEILRKAGDQAGREEAGRGVQAVRATFRGCRQTRGKEQAHAGQDSPRHSIRRSQEALRSQGSQDRGEQQRETVDFAVLG